MPSDTVTMTYADASDAPCYSLDITSALSPEVTYVIYRDVASNEWSSSFYLEPLLEPDFRRTYIDIYNDEECAKL